MDSPINTLLSVSMENIKKMIDVDTIVGTPIVNGDATIIPISRVKLGFLTGGSEIGKEGKPPFGGAAGSNMTIEPMCFIVMVRDDVKLLALGDKENPLEYIIKSIPKIVENTKSLFKDEAEGMKI